MKRIFIYSTIAIFISALFSSCLFVNEEVGSELLTGTIEGETVVHLGEADIINYKHEVTEDGLHQALAKMGETQLLGQIMPAQYSLRGGKEGNMPGSHAYQYQYNLQIDNYAGYLTLPQDFGGRMRSTYYNSQDFNGGAMGAFMQVQNFIVPVLNHPQIDSIPEIKAISLLIYNLAAQEVADVYGPFPYVDYKANKQEPPYVYNSLDTIYGTIVNNIDTIVAAFDYFESKPEWYKSEIQMIINQYDRVSHESGDRIEYWKRFANSLKLRMALNAVKIEPELAKKWAEEAVQSGVIEEEKQQFMLQPALLGFSHPLIEISKTWNDTRLNASFESILKSFEHPALEFLFTKNSHPIINKDDATKIFEADRDYVGLRAGIRMLSDQSYDLNFRVAYSRPSDAILQMPLFLIKLSEVLFLRAEGALHGWSMGGTAESLYTEGIEKAYMSTQLEIYDEVTWEPINFQKDIYTPNLSNYMNLEESKKANYEDPYDKNYNATSLINIGVKWNNSDDNEVKLEKIITQKYIAGYPNSYTAWTDLRRTGYPKIYSVVHDDGDGSIIKGDIIRRIPFSGTDQESTRNDIANTGVPALGGPDQQGTRLWWDYDSPNF